MARLYNDRARELDRVSGSIPPAFQTGRVGREASWLAVTPISGSLSGRMRRAIPVLLALAALAGCGDASDPSPDEPTRATTSTPGATRAPSTNAGGGDSPFLAVTSLLGKPLRKEPGCRFAETFIPNNPTASTYDGGLALTVTCKRSEGYTPLGQIVNRRGSKPTEIMCRDTTSEELYCIYVPSSTVGLYFTGTDRPVVRRRLQHLMETVASLPNGITPFSNAATP